MSARAYGYLKGSPHGDLGSKGKRPAMTAYPAPLVIEPLADSIDPADLLTISDVAEQLGLSLSTTKNRVWHAGATVGRDFGKRRITRYYSQADVERLRGMP